MWETVKSCFFFHLLPTACSLSSVNESQQLLPQSWHFWRGVCARKNRYSSSEQLSCRCDCCLICSLHFSHLQTAWQGTRERGRCACWLSRTLPSVITAYCTHIHASSLHMNWAQPKDSFINSCLEQPFTFRCYFFTSLLTQRVDDAAIRADGVVVYLWFYLDDPIYFLKPRAQECSCFAVASRLPRPCSKSNSLSLV